MHVCYVFLLILSAACDHMGDISRDGLDEWIATLMECKPITEAQVKQLCDKVCCKYDAFALKSCGAAVLFFVPRCYCFPSHIVNASATSVVVAAPTLAMLQMLQ